MLRAHTIKPPPAHPLPAHPLTESPLTESLVMNITYLGHSAFFLTTESHRVLIDPFLSANPNAVNTPGLCAHDIDPTHLVLTHGHDDHVGDAAEIAKRTGSPVFAAFELCNFLEEQGVKNLEPGNPGGRINTPFGFVAFTQAFHSSSSGGRYLGQPCGIVVSMNGQAVYHAGDTALFSDMALIGELYRPDVAILPIGDRFTMGPEQASRAADLIMPSVCAIPCHFNTWPPIEVDPARFAPKDVAVNVLSSGQTHAI